MTIESDDMNVVFDEEEANAIAALSASDVDAIDQAILSSSSRHWKKSALIIAIAMYVYPDKYDAIPDVFYGQRLLALVQKGVLEASGDLRQWRFSELRLMNV